MDEAVGFVNLAHPFNPEWLDMGLFCPTIVIMEGNQADHRPGGTGSPDRSNIMNTKTITISGGFHNAGEITIRAKIDPRGGILISEGQAKKINKSICAASRVVSAE